jgi:hypothetical protein
MLFKNPHQKENSSLILLSSSQYLPIFLILSTSSSPILSSTTNPLKIASHLIPSYPILCQAITSSNPIQTQRIPSKKNPFKKKSHQKTHQKPTITTHKKKKERETTVGII